MDVFLKLSHSLVTRHARTHSLQQATSLDQQSVLTVDDADAFATV